MDALIWIVFINTLQMLCQCCLLSTSCCFLCIFSLRVLFFLLLVSLFCFRSGFGVFLVSVRRLVSGLEVWRLKVLRLTWGFVPILIMAEEVRAEKVTFVNQNKKSFKVNLFGPKKNRVRVATVLAAFEASLAFLADDSVMEADDEGLSMDTFAAGVTYNLTVRPVVPQGGALPDTTVGVLEKLIQPFDLIPENLDVVVLQNLLTTDLRIKVPCLSYALASNFKECLQHSTIEECSKLENLLASFLNGPRRARGASENALISLWDRLVADLPELMHEVLHFPISTNRNVIDESLSTFMDRRDYLLYLETLPVVFGEEKRYDSEMPEAMVDLRKKHRGAPGQQIYGRLRYLICYAAAGESRFQVFAVPVGIAHPELIPLTRAIDPSLPMGRVELLKTFVNVIRWVHTVHRQELIGGLLLHNLLAPFRRRSPYDMGEVEITLYGNHVKKVFKVPTQHLPTLLHVYRVLCSEKIRCSIQLERMRVDGRVHLPVMEDDSEETESELLYAVVELKLKPTAGTVKPRDETDIKLLVSCILKAIVDLHKHNICHRDIRMANILRTPTEWILIDFELAAEDGECVFWNSETLTGGSQYWKHQDLKQLAGVIEFLRDIAGPSLLQFARELRKMESAAQALARFDASP